MIVSTMLMTINAIWCWLIPLVIKTAPASADPTVDPAPNGNASATHASCPERPVLCIPWDLEDWLH